jgi:hypothetical protein
MSGVIDVDTLAPSETRTEIGISLLNARLLSQGTFGRSRGEWLLSVRRGYLREVMEYIDDSAGLDPRYYDLLAKLQWRLEKPFVVSAHLMAANDRLRVDEPFEAATATYRDQYFWLNARGSVTERLFLQSVASIGQLNTTRNGSYGEPDFAEIGSVHDDRSAQIVALKNDASFDLTRRNLIKAGITFRRAKSSYDYDADATIRFRPVIPGGPAPDFTRHTHLDVSGSEMSAYLADRIRLTERLVAEAGVRLDSESYTPDGAHINPRLNLAWAAGPRTSVRAAWGRFAQPQSIYELQVEDGVNDFGEAQWAEHRVIGIDQALPGGVTARLEVYDKEFSDLRPRFENIFDRVVLFPELRHDRVRIDAQSGRARGAELLLRLDSRRPVSGFLSYSRAEVTDRIDGRDVPRAWDQPDALAFSVNYKRGAAWNFNVAGTFHTGWPTTPVTAAFVDGSLQSEAGPLNSQRLPSYRRVDLRISRNVPAGRGAVSLFVELFNVLSQENVVRVNSFDFSVDRDGVIDVTPRYESLFGILPSFGVTWQF